MRILVTLISIVLSFAVCAQPLPWLSAIGDTESIDRITSVESSAKVEVSDGLTYRTATSWQDNERTLFHREYPDRLVTMGRSGEYYWAYDNERQQDLDAGMKDFILGHQFHAFLLFFDQFEMSGEPTQSDSQLCYCDSYSDIDKGGNTHTIHYQKNNKLPLFIVTQYKEHGKVQVKLAEWKKTQGLSMPYLIEITHEARVFNYRFDEVTFNSNEKLNQLITPYDKLDDKQQLIRLHRDMIDAHIESDGHLMDHVWAKEVMIVNRGEIQTTTGEQASKMMSDSLKTRVHSRYVDLIAPKVTISADGNLGHIAVQVYAQGNRLDASGKLGKAFSFTSAWIATFEKQEGNWRLTANASNFK